MYYIYMLRCADNSIYTGITTDIQRRIEEHFTRNEKCAKYTFNHYAKELLALWQTDTKSNASKLEYYIKKLIKKEKEDLVTLNNMQELLKEKISIENYTRVK